MPSPPPPSPAHLLRSHSTQLSTVFVSDDNERLYSGDASGLVVITSTRSLRAIASWKAHTDGLLGVQELEDNIITHGRDNKLHVWKRVEEASISVGSSAALPGLPMPTLQYSMDVNALNYCRFSLLPPLFPGGVGERSDDASEVEALIALPNLVESSLADIWTLPSRRRLHAAIGKTDETSSDGRGINTTGIIMSMHLFTVPPTSVRSASSSKGTDELRLLCAYEHGGVILWRFARTDKSTSVEGIGWEAVWSVKLHKESVMAMAVSKDSKFALTVSADHLVGRYDLAAVGKSDSSFEMACVAHRTKHPGNAAVAIRNDGKVCAVGGWDGKIRLYSTRSLKPLGTLEYHKTGCQTVAFARSLSPYASQVSNEDEADDDDMSEEEKLQRSRWLVAGGKDGRVSIWALMSFEKK